MKINFKPIFTYFFLLNTIVLNTTALPDFPNKLDGHDPEKVEQAREWYPTIQSIFDSIDNAPTMGAKLYYAIKLFNLPIHKDVGSIINQVAQLNFLLYTFSEDHYKKAINLNIGFNDQIHYIVLDRVDFLEHQYTDKEAFIEALFENLHVSLTIKSQLKREYRAYNDIY